MLVLILFNVVKCFTNSKCLVDKATFIQLFKCKHSYLNFCKHSTNKQIDPCGRGSLTRSARRRRRGMNDAYMYTVLTLSLHFLTHYTVATYIRPTLYLKLFQCYISLRNAPNIYDARQSVVIIIVTLLFRYMGPCFLYML